MNHTSDTSCLPTSPEKGSPESSSPLERAICQALDGSAGARPDETDLQRVLAQAVESDTDAERTARNRLLAALSATASPDRSGAPAPGAIFQQIPPHQLPML